MPLEEFKSTSIKEIVKDTGLRFNNKITVGSYFAWGSNYYGYFSDEYNDYYNANVTKYLDGNMDLKEHKGYSIYFLVQREDNIVFNLLSANKNDSLITRITINGKTCTFDNPDIYDTYSVNCDFKFNLNIGSILEVDIDIE